MDLALNNLQWLICHKTKPNQTYVQPNDWHLIELLGLSYNYVEFRIGA